MPRADFYFLLGVPRGASMDSVRAAYRALAKQLHPDANPSHDAAARFAAIAEAYEVLSDRVKRRAYDAAANGTAGARDQRGADSPFAQGHYAWASVAGTGAAAAADVSEFDALYDTFFESAIRAPSDGPGKARASKKRTGRA